MDDSALSDLAARLRELPFYDFDYTRVAVRAYYLGERHPDGLRNWLQAEFEESLLQVEQLFIVDAPAKAFLEDYQLVGKARFATNEARAKEVWGKKNDRCSICGRSAPAVSFKTDAHLLPACTGNRFLFTANECDSCNLSSGRDTENELGKMLSVHRAMHQVQTREKPSATHRLQKGGSSLGGQSRGAPLDLTVIEGEPSIRVEDCGDNTLRIHATSAPFRPISALRSLGRSAWHLVPTELRAEHLEILEWVKGEAGIQPLRYVEVFVPGPGLRHTTLAVWVRREPCAHQPSLVFGFALGTSIIIVPLCPRLWERIPYPPLPRSRFGDPQLRTLAVFGDESGRQTFSYDVRYMARSLRGIPDGAPARIEIRRETDAVGLDTQLGAIPLPETSSAGPVEYVLTGGELCGEIRLVGSPVKVADDGEILGGDYLAEYAPPPADAEIISTVASSTYRFLEAFTAGGVLRLTVGSNERFSVEMLLEPGDPAALDEIRRALGLS